MTTDKANTILNFAMEHDMVSLRAIDEALMVLIQDLQARVKELEGRQ